MSREVTGQAEGVPRRGEGATTTLNDWIARRHPPVPGSFGEWMGPRSPGAAPDWESLLAETRASLKLALDPDGRPRKGAFDLLAADGFATWACEAALETDDPEAVLERLVQALAE